jgi:hypothetical protein
MAQLFPPSANTLARVFILGGTLLLCVFSWGVCAVSRSPWATWQYVVRDQPVPFSHQHHVAGLGLDCRFCHTSVENSAFAGVPSTKICMTCHSQIWTNAQMLEPVRESWRANIPIQWNRVHNLAGYVYFDHSIHVQKGVGCSTCHGRVQDMPLTYQASTLQMRWCLDCHRDPEAALRPRDQVFNMEWEPPADQRARGAELAVLYHVLPKQQMQNCSTCHR